MPTRLPPRREWPDDEESPELLSAYDHVAGVCLIAFCTAASFVLLTVLDLDIDPEAVDGLRLISLGMFAPAALVAISYLRRYIGTKKDR